MRSSNKYKAVVFDLFGTLVSTFSSREHDIVLDKMARVLGVENALFARVFDYDMRAAREKGEYSTIEENIKVACHQLGVKPKPDDIQRAAMYRYEFMKRALWPRDDAIQTLKRIKEKGFAVGLISDCSPEVPEMWGETPFAKLIDASVFSCDVGIKKPDLRIYRWLCERLDVEARECLYVGDGDSSELEGALKIGMEPVLIRVEGEDGRDRDRPVVDKWKGKRISALREVLKYV